MSMPIHCNLPRWMSAGGAIHVLNTIVHYTIEHKWVPCMGLLSRVNAPAWATIDFSCIWTLYAVDFTESSVE